MREKDSNELEMLRKQHIIEDVKHEPTPWTSPIVVFPKNHYKIKTRLCIDMWEDNNAIGRTHYPSPSLKDLIKILQGSKIYCKLDMKNAFLQFWLDSASQEISCHLLRAYVKFSEQLTFLTPWYVHVHVRIRGLEILVSRKVLRT